MHEGGCNCGHVRYRMTSEPLTVNCCHCRMCQRLSGTAFALNAMIEADRIELIEGEPEHSMRCHIPLEELRTLQAAGPPPPRRTSTVDA